MTIQQLKYLIEIVRCGSINEAAKRLFITQPSLSNAMKELEHELGISIFRRTNRGIVLSSDGTEFLKYARQILEQIQLMEQRYLNGKPPRRIFSVSTQHYAFSVNAFVNLIKEFGKDEYEFTIRECKTHEIIEDVKHLKSEVGVLYINEFNEKVITKLLKENDLIFHSLFTATPHVFISNQHPLAHRKQVTLGDLEDFPYLSFEQGDYNSFYFSEEILSSVYRKKNIRVSDRATLFNLLIGLNGYTISTGVLSEDLNGENIIAVPLACEETIHIGWISHKNVMLGSMGEAYVEKLEQYILSYQI